MHIKKKEIRRSRAACISAKMKGWSVHARKRKKADKLRKKMY
jgi:hypothetical protein